MTALSVSRQAALSVIRALGYVVAVLAIAAAVVSTIIVITGGPVWRGTGFVQLPLPLGLVHVGAFALGDVTVAALAMSIGDLAWRVRRGVDFGPAVTRSVWTMAIVLAVGSWLTQIVAGIADHAALIYPDDTDPLAVDPNHLPIDWGIQLMSFLPDWPLLGLAVVLGVIAYIVRAAERLQRDVEGLV